MNNITYTINDPLHDNSYNPLNGQILSAAQTEKDVSSRHLGYSINEDNMVWEEYNELAARQIDYELNYTNKYLIKILEFYGFKKGKMKKKDMILKIIEYEMIVENKNNIEERKRLFNNFIELKKNTFFSKFIVGDFI
jgi:hypothetical protein